MGHTPRKRFGQNFLRDESIIDAIARAIAPTDADHVVEIGPGEGALTEALITSGCQLDAIELDRDLRTRLLAAFSTLRRLHPAQRRRTQFRFCATGNWEHPAPRSRQPALQHLHTADFQIARSVRGHCRHALYASAGSG
jgi:hypothetical protein